jgi:large subunit ribosomal protein L36
LAITNSHIDVDFGNTTPVARPSLCRLSTERTISHAMASLFNSLSLRAMALAPRRAIGTLFSSSSSGAAATTMMSGSLAQTLAATTRTQMPVFAGALQQQTRGMKVHSAVKKRCEHCKVSKGKKKKTPEKEQMAPWFPPEY